MSASSSSRRLLVLSAAAITKMPSAAVLYHYPCPDGAFAALAAHLYFSSSATSAIQSQPLFLPNAVYDPLTPSGLAAHGVAEAEVYLLDFVGPAGFANDVASRAKSVVVLDHHKTALEGLAPVVSGGNVMAVIDMNRSGATIAFDYFKARVTNAKVLAEFDRMRRFFEYIEDGDLWHWRLPNSKAFSSGFKDLNLEFDVNANPSLFDQLLSLDLDSLISQGKKSLAEKQRLIDEALSRSYKIALGGGRFGNCLAVYADSIPWLRSELGHQLATKSLGLNLRGIGAVVYRVPELKDDRLLKISLRSVEKEDTTVVSQEYKGGGHRNASSFMLDAEEFCRWKVSKNA